MADRSAVASPRPLLVVLALNYDEFRRWCRESGLSTEDRDVVYTNAPDRLHGISNAKVIRCPRWHQHHRAGDFDRQARRIEQRSR
ncbi:hypothetical protein [Streptomyces sp. NPDC047000]|uniref:hypothetical protein n=1 Tax=Streptomyces sp. NPDC047000 TaxID=3155474 RepID=UPI0033D0655E